MCTEMTRTAAGQKLAALQSGHSPTERKEERGTGPGHEQAGGCPVPNSSSEIHISRLQQTTQKVLRGTRIQGTHQYKTHW